MSCRVDLPNLTNHFNEARSCLSLSLAFQLNDLIDVILQYLGCVEVFESRGMQICEEALKVLRVSNGSIVKLIRLSRDISKRSISISAALSAPCAVNSCLSSITRIDRPVKGGATGR